MSKESTRDKGKKLEYIVAESLKPYDPRARPSKNSGAGMYKGDIYLEELPFHIEAKNYTQKNINLSRDIWDKHISEMSVVDKRIPLIVTNMTGIETPFVFLRWTDFMTMVDDIYEVIE